MLSALKESLKTETDMYMLRVNGQIDRYMNIANNQDRDNLQGQIDTIKDSIEAIMCELMSRDPVMETGDMGMMSPITLEEELLDEQPVIVHKLRAEEIKKVHIETEVATDDVASVSGASVGKVSVSGASLGKVSVVSTSSASVSNTVDSPTPVTPMSTPVATPVTPMPTPVATPVPTPVATPISPTLKDAAAVPAQPLVEENVGVEDVEEEEEAEEEEEGVEVDEIEYKGVTYFKDTEGIVYECTEDGDVGEAIGVMSKKIAGKVVFYATN